LKPILKIRGGTFDLENQKREIETLESGTLKQDFWDSRENAEQVLSKLKKVKTRYEKWETLRRDFANLKEYYLLAIDEKDQSVENEIRKNLESIDDNLRQAKLIEYLNDEYDEASAFLTIHSGAGGTEACDWAKMLLRMYTRWAESRGYKVDIIDFNEADGGIKSVCIEISGLYAYGYLKTESGVHRLVRISPFDANKRRHTSFASVYCTPVVDDNIQVDIKPEDIRVDTFRASGAGGQHINKTDSAIRITHFPTGIVVQCQNERSQFKNKAIAMKVLLSRLYEQYKKEKDTEMEKIGQQKKDIAWGSQIRSYVFQPYTMVKDHRTKHEVGNIQAVMDGKIDAFIEDALKLAKVQIKK
jgi:peptide chain release factor 2